MNWYKTASYSFHKGDSAGGFPIYEIYSLEDALAFFKLPIHWARFGIPNDFTIKDLKNAKSAIFRTYRDINVNTIAVLEANAYRKIKNIIEKRK